MIAFQPLQVPLRGLALIEASAGTGKTYTISTLYLRMLLERRLEVDEILVVTFTEAATEELRERIRKRLAEALDWLQDNVFESGAAFDVEFITDEARLRATAVEDFWRSRVACTEPEEGGRFWTFFPTETPARVPSILNAPWKLHNGRKSILGGEEDSFP